MGEKGNAADAVAAAQSAAGSSLIERTTTVATTTVVDAGEDLAIAVRDAAIDSVADDTVAKGREKLEQSRQDPTSPDDSA